MIPQHTFLDCSSRRRAQKLHDKCFLSCRSSFSTSHWYKYGERDSDGDDKVWGLGVNQGSGIGFQKRKA